MSVDPAEAKQIAAELISEAWQEAVNRGISTDLIASTALTAALSSLVETQGQESTIRIASQLLDAVTNGKFGHTH